MNQILISFLLSMVALLAAITFHEFMHAWTANYLGDPTAQREGRISLNPFVHLDLLGTIMILLVHFGWGKPVPINPNNFRNPRWGSAITALAGPVANLLLVLFSTIVLKLPGLSFYVRGFFGYFLLYNLALMLFNLLPLAPLDGSKFFALFFPGIDEPRFQMYSIPILLLIVFFGQNVLSAILVFFLNLLGVPLNVLAI